jgi:hypothetical protein
MTGCAAADDGPGDGLDDAEGMVAEYRPSDPDGSAITPT